MSSNLKEVEQRITETRRQLDALEKEKAKTTQASQKPIVAHAPLTSRKRWAWCKCEVNAELLIRFKQRAAQKRMRLDEAISEAMENWLTLTPKNEKSN